MTDAHDILEKLLVKEYESAVIANNVYQETQLAKARELEEHQKKKLSRFNLCNAKLLAKHRRAIKAEEKAKSKMNKEPAVIKYRKALRKRQKITREIDRKRWDWEREV